MFLFLFPLAQTLHQRHRIDRVYTKQEELIIRAAHLRKLLNIEQAESLYPEDAIPFREKYEMRRRADDGGFPSPKFKRILSPCDIVSFIQCYDYPVIVKPTLGCASAGVHVLRNQADRDSYLEHGFYSSLNDLDGELDHNGDLIIETFVDGEMFHVNGYSKRGQIESVWPFKYLKTNLDFTMGESYGNAIIPRSDITLWQGLLDSAKHILKIFPTPSDLFFHMELFQLKDRSKKSLSRLTNIPEKLDEDKPIFILCEIAARRPGGSIGMLIDSFELKQNPGWPSFPEYEFRVNVGLVPTVEPCALTRPNSIFCSTTSTKHTPVIADLMIPLKIGKLVSLPVLPEEGDANTVRQDVDTGHSMSKVGSFCTLFTNGVNISSSVAEIVPISDCALVKSSVEVSCI